MKLVINALLAIIWLLLTFILTLTIFGMFIFLVEDSSGNPIWFKFGNKFVENIS